MKQIQINKYTNLELAFMCLFGWLGNGTERVKYLGDRYGKVQPLVNEIALGKVPIPNYKDDMLACIKNALLKYKPTEEDYLEYVDDLVEIVSKEVSTDG